MAVDSFVIPEETRFDIVNMASDIVSLVSPAEQPASPVQGANIQATAETIPPVIPEKKAPAENVDNKSAVTEPCVATKPEDAVKDQVQAVSDELAAAKAKLLVFEGSRPSGRLKELERKAMEYDLISEKMEAKEKAIAKYQMEVKSVRGIVTNQNALVVFLIGKTNELTAAMKPMREEIESLKETLRILRLGKYEYYQIEEKDTCESIAAKPSIYGDESKNTLIRQANRGNVANLEKLVPGEVLIIPRVSVSEINDF